MTNNIYRQQEEYVAPPRDNIGALWKKNDKIGKDYLVGRVKINGQEQEIIVFSNTDKVTNRQPDYVIREQTKRDNQIRSRDDRPRASQHNWY